RLGEGKGRQKVLLDGVPPGRGRETQVGGKPGELRQADRPRNTLLRSWAPISRVCVFVQTRGETHGYQKTDRQTTGAPTFCEGHAAHRRQAGEFHRHHQDAGKEEVTTGWRGKPGRAGVAVAASVLASVRELAP